MSFDLAKMVLQPDEGESLIVGPTAARRVIIKIAPKNTGEARLAMGVQLLEAGGVIGVHLHEGLEELIFVYGGRGKAIIQDDEVELVPGTTIYVPRRVWHGITNTGNEPLRLTWTVCPPGLEDYFRERNTRFVHVEPDQTAPARSLDHDLLAKMAERHGMKLRRE